MDNKQAKTKGETPDSISIEMEKLRSEIAQQAATIFYLQHELDKLKRMIFGQKRERFLADQPCQPTLFDLPEPLSAKTETVEVSYVRTKTAEEPKRGQFRALLPAHLPRVKQVVEPEIDTTKARKIGEEITEILEYTPGSLFVRQIIRPKYTVNG